MIEEGERQKKQCMIINGHEDMNQLYLNHVMVPWDSVMKEEHHWEVQAKEEPKCLLQANTDLDTCRKEVQDL